jgi:predicted O-linked N-acetylglucosamine transferase (SPINDLY family)
VRSLNQLGRAFAEQSDHKAAISVLRRAIELRPQSAELHNNLGLSLLGDMQLDAAIGAFRAAVILRSDYSQALFNLGNALQDKGMPAEAIDSYRRALAAQPDSAETWHALGTALRTNGQLDEAIASYQKAIDLGFNSFEVYSNLGTAVRTAGDIDNAIRYLRRAVELKPCSIACHNLLYSIHLHPDYDARRIYEEHQRWNRACAEPEAASIAPHENDRTPDRRLRVGYVSPDFRRHSVGGFMLPLLSNHDPAEVEIYCYSDVLRPDAMTAQLRQQTSVWRDISGIRDEQVADIVRTDRIDILVDLTMHLAGSRLLMFARKPAPVQVTYLAYCSTTGLRTMDYRLTDPYLDPPGGDDTVYSEKSHRLPKTYWCYAPQPEAPPVGPLPASTPGHVTFGCLNNFAKISPPVLALWQQLLHVLPASNLILHCDEGRHRQRLRDQFQAIGVNPQRVQFVHRLPLNQYYELHRQIDIALDPFPYSGGTTTLDALWMGVPVVSLVGQTAVSRGGLSVLSNAGLPELVARTPEQYIRIAADLANDLPQLGRLRSSLRDRMRSSPLLDPATFARDVEQAYRQIWVAWCTLHQKRERGLGQTGN